MSSTFFFDEGPRFDEPTPLIAPRSLDHNIQIEVERRAYTTPYHPAFLWVEPSVFNEWRTGRRRDIFHRPLSFAALLARTESVGAGFKELGIAAGDRVLVCAPHSLELSVAVAALQRIGAVPVLVDRWTGVDVLAVCARQTRPRAIVAPAAAYSLFSSIPELRDAAIRVTLGSSSPSSSTDFASLLQNKVACAIEPVNPEDIALVTYHVVNRRVYGAHRSHQVLRAQAEAFDTITQADDRRIQLSVSPTFAFGNLTRGVTTILPVIDPHHPDRFDGQALVEQMRATEASSCVLSPELLRALSESASRRVELLPSLKRVFSIGLPLSRDDVVALELVLPRARLQVLYGTFEVEPIAHIPAEEIPASTLDGIPIGAIAPGLDAKLMRFHRGPIRRFRSWSQWEAIDEPGELVLRGDHVCARVDADQTEDHSHELFDDQGNRWHRTGDMCRVDERGQLHVLGRLENTIMRDGKLVFNTVAETLMNRLPSIEASALIGVPDEVLGHRVAAVFKARRDADPELVRDDIARVLKDAGVPVDEIGPVATIPVRPDDDPS
ncbi:MAG: AMP-binding protein [Myxococcota bacterium]